MNNASLTENVRLIRQSYRRAWSVIWRSWGLILVPVLINVLFIYLPQYHDTLIFDSLYPRSFSPAAPLIRICRDVITFSSITAMSALSNLCDGFWVSSEFFAIACALLQIPLMLFLRRHCRSEVKRAFTFLWIWLAVVLLVLPSVLVLWNRYVMGDHPLGRGWAVVNDSLKGCILAFAKAFFVLPVATALETVLLVWADFAVRKIQISKEIINEAFSRFFPLLIWNGMLWVLCFVLEARTAFKVLSDFWIFDVPRMEILYSVCNAAFFAVPFFIVIEKKSLRQGLVSQWRLFRTNGGRYVLWLLVAFIVLWAGGLLGIIAQTVHDIRPWFWPLLWGLLKSMSILGAVWVYVAFIDGLVPTGHRGLPQI